MTQTTTKSGKKFTYVGWLRKYNAADFPGKMALGREYPEYANRRVREMDERSNRKPEEVTRAAKEEKAERAKFRKMPIAELRREYYGTLKESMGGPFAPTAKRAHTMIEAELKRRKASPKYPDPKPKPTRKPAAPRKHAPAKSATQKRSRGRLLTSTKPDYPRLSVRARSYRGMDGYVISGRDTIGRNVSIFARTKTEAQRIKRDLLTGEPVRFDNEGSVIVVHRY